MNIDDIKVLIQSYYNGDTSPEEEDFLLGYFSGDNVAKELQPEKEYFMQLSKLKQTDIPTGFSSKMDALFEDLGHKGTVRIRRKRLLIWAGGIAAAIAIIAFFATDSYNINNQPVLSQVDSFPSKAEVNKPDTVVVVGVKEAEIVKEKTQTVPVKKNISKEEIDYQKIKEALESVALNLNEGLEQLNSVSENLAQTTEIIDSDKYK